MQTQSKSKNMECGMVIHMKLVPIVPWIPKIIIGLADVFEERIQYLLFQNFST